MRPLTIRALPASVPILRCVLRPSPATAGNTTGCVTARTPRHASDDVDYGCIRCRGGTAARSTGFQSRESWGHCLLPVRRYRDHRFEQTCGYDDGGGGGDDDGEADDDDADEDDNGDEQLRQCLRIGQRRRARRCRRRRHWRRRRQWRLRIRRALAQRVKIL